MGVLEVQVVLLPELLQKWQAVHPIVVRSVIVVRVFALGTLVTRRSQHIVNVERLRDVERRLVRRILTLLGGVCEVPARVEELVPPARGLRVEERSRGNQAVRP